MYSALSGADALALSARRWVVGTAGDRGMAGIGCGASASAGLEDALVVTRLSP